MANKENNTDHDIRKVINTYGDSLLKEEMSNIQLKMMRERQRKYLLIAASITIFLVVGVSLVMNNSTSSIGQDCNELLASELNKTFPMINIRSIDASTQKNEYFQLAMRAYENQNFEEASIQFERLISKEPSPGRLVRFHYALSLLKEGALEESLVLLEQLESENKVLMREQIKWYLALNHLKLEDKEKGKECLEEGNFSAYKKTEADQLLQCLNSDQ